MFVAMKPSRRNFSIFLLSISLFSFTQVKSASAADLKRNPRTATAAQSASTKTATQSTAAAGVEEADISAQTQSVIINPSAERAAVGTPPPPGGAGQASSSATAPTPLTPAQKFKYSLRSSFKPPMPYALSALSGIFSEVTDNDHHRHMTAGDFLADSATHAARSLAFRTTANFFEKFAFAAAFHQDPRYFRSDKHGFARIGYALSRVFITQG